MTTIACDGRLICGDGRSQTSWGIITSEKVKKIVPDEDAIYAVAGVGALIGPLIAWHKAKCPPRDVPMSTMEGGWSLFVWPRSGSPELYTSHAPYKDICEVPFAMGAGMEIALGVMDHGGSAAEAVKIAMRRHSGSGGAIQAVDIAEALGLAPPTIVPGRRQVSRIDHATGKRKIRIEETAA